MHKASATVELALLFPVVLGSLLFLFVFILLMYQDAAFAAKLDNNALRVSNSVTDDNRSGDGKVKIDSLYRESKEVYANSDPADITAVYLAQADYGALLTSITSDLSAVSFLKRVKEESKLSLEGQDIVISMISGMAAPVPFIGNLSRETSTGAYAPVLNPSVYIRNADAAALIVTEIYEDFGYLPLSDDTDGAYAIAAAANYQSIYDSLRVYAQIDD
jgi:hypothetical protein